MAISRKLSDILKKLASGTIVSGAKIRSKMGLLEVNVLRLKEQEAKDLERVINLELAKSKSEGNDKAIDKFQKQKDFFAKRTVLSDGSVELPPVPLATIKNIQKQIDKTHGDGYDLGHLEVSQLIQKMIFVKEYYVNSETKHHVNDEQVQLIDSMIVAAQTIDNISNKSLRDLAKFGGAVDELTLLNLLKSSDGHENYTLSASGSFLGSIKKGSGRIVYELEISSDNLLKGQLSQILDSKFRSLFNNTDKVSKDAIGGEAKKLLAQADPFRIITSPTMIDRISMELDAELLGFKSKNKPSRGKVLKERRKIRNQRSQAKILQNKVKNRLRGLKTKLAAIKAKKKFLIPTVTLKAIINQSLKDFIQLRMQSAGSASSINYLRNQTGRFSESARLLTLNRQETGAYIGIYTYQKEPYQVFEQGHKLGSPGRDPRLYIEGAARDIATQVLRNNFKGLALELN